MFKFTSFFFCFLVLANLAFAQSETDLTDEQYAYLAEHGSSTRSILQNEDINFSDDPSTWNSLTNAPNVFGRSIGGVIGDYLYIFGGQDNPSLALAFHILSNSWSNSTPANSSASNAGYCVANGELYKISGTGAVSVFEKFTPVGSGTGTWTSLAAGPSAVMNAQNSMIWDGGDYIYVNTATFATPPVPSFARYQISSNSWVNMPVSIIGRKYAGMAVVNNEIFLIGGLTETGGDGTICQKYNIASQTWSIIAPLPEPVTFTKWTVTSDNNYLYLISAGGGYTGFPIIDKVYYYNPSTNTWLLESTLPAPRGLALGFLMTGFSKLFFGGGNDGTSSTNYQVHTWEGTGGPYIPVELSSFTATAINNNVQLKWSTASELNNMGFEIERKGPLSTPSLREGTSQTSLRGDWGAIGYVDGYGTTTDIQHYSFSDNNLESGVYSYRLKQIDFDGTFSYSNTIEVDLNGLTSFTLEQNYPNPFNPSTKIKYTIPLVGTSLMNFVQLKVFDVLGNEVATLVNELKPAGVYEVTFNASELSSGVYIYKLQTGDYISARKMLLTK